MPRKIVLVLPMQKPAQLPDLVEAWLASNVVLIAVAGPGSARVEAEIDTLIVGDGADEDRFAVTTSHDTLGEAIGFAEAWDTEPPTSVEVVDGAGQQVPDGWQST